ncbi:unnamed protein product [Aureobasidium pullulans]|nr:unnamed protein product [Aureobasidium pullulans]
MDSKANGSSRIVNLATGALMVLGGISQFWPHVSVQSTICAVYIILFGLANALLVARYASFMFSFIGRGVFYIFVGGLCFSDNILKYLVGGVIILVGIAYVVLEYVPSIEPPANMRDADAGWGAEQV